MELRCVLATRGSDVYLQRAAAKRLTTAHHLLASRERYEAPPTASLLPLSPHIPNHQTPPSSFPQDAGSDALGGPAGLGSGLEARRNLPGESPAQFRAAAGPAGKGPGGRGRRGRCLHDLAELGAGLLRTCAPAPEVPPTTCCRPPKQRERVRQR